MAVPRTARTPRPAPRPRPEPQMAAPKQRVIVAGGSGLGSAVARALIAAGAEVTVISAARQPGGGGLKVVVGDEELPQDLKRAGIAEADCLVLVEDDDLANLRAAMLARSLNRKIRIVLRLFNASLATRKKLLPRCTVISPSLLVAPRLADLALGQMRAEPGPKGNAGRWRKRMGTAMRVAMAIADKRFGALAAVLVGLMAAGTLVFHGYGHWSWLDSLYFATATVATVGYGDLNLVRAPAAAKVFDIAFMLAGWLLMGALLAVITDAIIGERISRALGEPSKRLGGHIVIAGLGNVGFRVAELLHDRGYEVVCIEEEPSNRMLVSARRSGILVIVGDATDLDNLELAGVAGARAVLALSGNDLANLEVSLTSRDRNQSARIVTRLADPDLAGHAKRQLKIGHPFDINALAVPAFVAAALGR